MVAGDAVLLRSIAIRRTGPEKKTMGVVLFDEQVASGQLGLKRWREPDGRLKTMAVHFDLGFETMPGARGISRLTAKRQVFEREQLWGAPSGG